MHSTYAIYVPKDVRAGQPIRFTVNILPAMNGTVLIVSNLKFSDDEQDYLYESEAEEVVPGEFEYFKVYAKAFIAFDCH